MEAEVVAEGGGTTPEERAHCDKSSHKDDGRSVQRFGRNPKCAVVFDALFLRCLRMIGPPSMCDAGVRKSRAEGVRASPVELRITRSMLMECPAFIVPVEKWKPHEADDPDDHARPGGCVLRQPQGTHPRRTDCVEARRGARSKTGVRGIGL